MSGTVAVVLAILAVGALAFFVAEFLARSR